MGNASSVARAMLSAKPNSPTNPLIAANSVNTSTKEGWKLSTMIPLIDSGRPSSIGSGEILTGKPTLPNESNKITFIRWRRTRYRNLYRSDCEAIGPDPRGSDTSIFHAFFPADLSIEECWNCGLGHDGPEDHKSHPHKMLCGIRQYLSDSTVAAYEINLRPSEGSVCRSCLAQLKRLGLEPFWFKSDDQKSEITL